MLNLVGNTCIASWITNEYIKQSFINPFTWCVMQFESCYNLVKYWDELNFDKYELVREDGWNFSIIIDEKVKVQYVHYIFDPKYEQPTKVGEDIRSSKIWEYIIDKYITRVKRMKELNIDPIFIFTCAKSSTNQRCHFTVKEQEQLLALNSKYKIILSFDKMPAYQYAVKQSKNYTGNTKEMAKEFLPFIND